MYHRIARASKTEAQNFHMQDGQYYMVDTNQIHRGRMENTNPKYTEVSQYSKFFKKFTKYACIFFRLDQNRVTTYPIVKML